MVVSVQCVICKYSSKVNVEKNQSVYRCPGCNNLTRVSEKPKEKRRRKPRKKKSSE